MRPTSVVAADPCTHGLVLLADSQRKGEKPSVKRLAAQMGVSRQSLYENKDFAPVREAANKLFGLFEAEAKKGDWHGPRGSKAKHGVVEAVDPDEPEL